MVARHAAPHVEIAAPPPLAEAAADEEPFRRDRTPKCCESLLEPKWFVAPDFKVTPTPDPPSLSGVEEAVRVASRTSCRRVRATNGTAAASAEASLLFALRYAHANATANDATPAEEKQIVMWLAYDAAVAEFTAAHKIALRPHVARDLLAQPNVEAALAANIAARWGKKLGSDKNESLMELERGRARAAVAPIVEEVVDHCTLEVVDESKGRWVAVLKGKD